MNNNTYNVLIIDELYNLLEKIILFKDDEVIDIWKYVKWIKEFRKKFLEKYADYKEELKKIKYFLNFLKKIIIQLNIKWLYWWSENLLSFIINIFSWKEVVESWFYNLFFDYVQEDKFNNLYEKYKDSLKFIASFLNQNREPLAFYIENKLEEFKLFNILRIFNMLWLRDLHIIDNPIEYIFVNNYLNFLQYDVELHFSEEEDENVSDYIKIERRLNRFKYLILRDAPDIVLLWEVR